MTVININHRGFIMEKFFLAIFICILFIGLIISGCGISSQINSLGDSMSSYDESDNAIPLKMSQSKSWAVYVVWYNENISGGVLSNNPNKSSATRIIVSPIYIDKNDQTGLNNLNTFEEWIKWMLVDNDDICYLATKIITEGTTYNEAYKVYRDEFTASKRDKEDIFHNGFTGDSIDWDLLRIKDPSKVYKNEKAEYAFDPIINVINQTRRNLEIKSGILELNK